MIITSIFPWCKNTRVYFMLQQATFIDDKRTTSIQLEKQLTKKTKSKFLNFTTNSTY